MLKYVPNILTIIRFLLIPPIVIAITSEHFVVSVIFLVLSGITDVLDGFIARKFDLITDFGKLVDPLADKATQLAILVTLSIKGVIPFWILAIVVLKEFAMIAGASFLYGRKLVVSSKWYRKTCNCIILCSNWMLFDYTLFK